MTHYPTDIPVSTPLPLEGTFNTRDLGGYPSKTGALTKTHVFLRSDNLASLTDDDKQYLSDYGVRCIVDLRTADEVRLSPCPMGPEYNISYHHVPLADNLSPASLAASTEGRMSDLYIALLDHASHTIADIMRIFLDHRSAPILFHCAAGKDRTGVISMLLLLLSGVPQDYVVADYSASAANLAPLIQHLITQLTAQGLTIPDYAFSSHPEDMRRTITHLEQTWGSAAAYLQSSGLSPTFLHHLTTMLLPT